jgi:hypothetical protein
VVLIGIAQEKAWVWRSWVAKGQERARHPHIEWGRQMAFVNHFYFYVRALAPTLRRHCPRCIAAWSSAVRRNPKEEPAKCL